MFIDLLSLEALEKRLLLSGPICFRLNLDGLNTAECRMLFCQELLNRKACRTHKIKDFQENYKAFEEIASSHYKCLLYLDKNTIDIG